MKVFCYRTVKTNAQLCSQAHCSDPSQLDIKREVSGLVTPAASPPCWGCLEVKAGGPSLAAHRDLLPLPCVLEGIRLDATQHQHLAWWEQEENQPCGRVMMKNDPIQTPISWKEEENTTKGKPAAEITCRTAETKLSMASGRYKNTWQLIKRYKQSLFLWNSSLV